MEEEKWKEEDQWGEEEDGRYSWAGEADGMEATVWRGGPCENGDVLNLC